MLAPLLSVAIRRSGVHTVTSCVREVAGVAAGCSRPTSLRWIPPRPSNRLWLHTVVRPALPMMGGSADSKTNLDQQRSERDSGWSKRELTPSASWSAYGLGNAVNQVKGAVAP